MAERTGLSEAAVLSYELGTRNPKDAHREVIAEALGVSADYLRGRDGRRESEVVHFLMKMEDAGFPRPVLIGGTAYVMPVQANLEDGIREWAEKERGLALREGRRGGIPPLEGLLRPLRRAKAHRKRGVNSHFDWDKAKMGPERMEEELVKLTSESDREAIRTISENRND